MRPRLFKLIDIAIIILATFISFLFINVAVEVDNIQAVILMLIMALSGWAAYGYVLWKRAVYYSAIRYKTKHGLWVAPYDTGVTRKMVEDEIDRTVSMWEDVTRRHLVPDYEDWILEIKKDVLPHPFYGALGPQFNGYILGNKIVVGHGTRRPMTRTALAHEIGHLLHAKLTGKMRDQECHQFMERNRLP